MNAIFLSVTVTFIDYLLRRQKGLVAKPARQAACRELCAIYLRLRLLWGRMVADSFSTRGWSGEAPNLAKILNGNILSAKAADIVSNLDLDTCVTICPTLTWEEYLDQNHQELLRDIDKVLSRYATILPPHIIQLLHGVENSNFMKAINRRKEEIHQDRMSNIFGYGGTRFDDFFVVMRELHADLYSFRCHLGLGGDDELPPGDWGGDLDSLSGDLLIRPAIMLSLYGQTYFSRFTYRQLIHNCLSSDVKYILRIIPMMLHDGCGNGVDVENYTGSVSFSLYGQVILRARNAKNLSEIVARAESSLSVQPNAFLVIPFASSDVYYPVRSEVEQFIQSTDRELDNGRLPGPVFSRSGNLLDL